MTKTEIIEHVAEAVATEATILARSGHYPMDVWMEPYNGFDANYFTDENGKRCWSLYEVRRGSTVTDEVLASGRVRN